MKSATGSTTTGASFTALTVTTNLFVTASPPASVALTLIRLVPFPFVANASVRFVPCVMLAVMSAVFVFPTTPYVRFVAAVSTSANIVDRFVTTFPASSLTTKSATGSTTTGASFTALTVTTKLFVTDNPLGSAALTETRLVPLLFAANTSVRFVPCVIVAVIKALFVFPTTA